MVKATIKQLLTHNLFAAVRCMLTVHVTRTTRTQQLDAHADQTKVFDNLLQVFTQIRVWL